MKKFFGKKCALISFVVASVIFVGGLLAMLLSPVFYIGSYTGGDGNEYFNNTYQIHFKSCKKYEVKVVRTTIATGKVETRVSDFWYFRKGDVVFSIGSVEDMTEEQYDEEVKKIKELDDKEYELAVKTRGSEINLRYMTIVSANSRVSYSNKSSLTFVIIDSVLAGIALVGTGLSVFYFVKAKKEKPKAEEKAE
ncbi:MAG: hypothetical protein IKB06_01290 [Clostridia bacterium]|nr:hypothetical protein [Clostridia bacterium]